MNSLLLRFFAALLLAVSLSGCGGGSSGPVPPTNAPPVANAGADQTVPVGVQATLDGSASSDADGDSLTYSWTLTGKPAGSVAVLTGPQTARPTLVPDKEGAYTASLVVSDGKAQSGASTTVVTATAAVAPAIAIDQTEPLSGTVKLSLTGTVTGAVTWYVDLNLLGSGVAADGNSIAWNTSGVANGEHQILARIQPSSSTFQDVRRAVQVSNSSVNLSASVSGTTGTINVDARASSTFGIASVSAVFDGKDAGTLTAPNACSRYCSGVNDVYRFVVDSAAAGSGPHTMRITATDGAGSSKQITVPVPISNAPVLTLSAPVDGAFAYGSLRVSGTAVSDKTGAVTVTAALGDVQFMLTTASSFNGSYDLTSVAAGSYTLTVRATDSTGQATQIQRTVIVTSSASLAYTPAFSLPAGGQLLAVEGTKALYSAGDGSILLRDVVTAAEVVLQGGTIAYANDWQVSSGRVYAFGQGNDCTTNFVCVYEWQSDGTRSNLSKGNPWAGGSYQQHPVARSGYVVWCNDGGGNGGSYTLYNAVSGSYTQVVPPSAVNYVGNWNYDFAAVGGVVHFYFWGQTGGSGTGSTFDIFRWTSDTATSTRLTAGGSRNIYPQTDGSRAAWQQSPAGGNADGSFSLVSIPVAGGTSSTVAAAAASFILKDGVLAWIETAATSRALKASTTSTTSTLSILSSAQLYASGGGQVVYGEQGRTHSWNSATRVVRLRVEAAPSQVFVSAGAMYFVLASSVYRVPLD